MHAVARNRIRISIFENGNCGYLLWVINSIFFWFVINKY